MQKIEPTTLVLVLVLAAVVAVAHRVHADELLVTAVSTLAIVVAGLAKSLVKGGGDAGK